MPLAYVEAQPKGRPAGSPITGYVVEDQVHQVLAITKNQSDAIDWATANGYQTIVARLRHLNDKDKPDHWQTAI